MAATCPFSPQQQIVAKANAKRLADQGFISQNAKAYLEMYAAGELPRRPRPAEYSFLRHRWQNEARVVAAPVQYEGQDIEMRPVRVVQLRGPDGRILPEEASDVEEAALDEPVPLECG